MRPIEMTWEQALSQFGNMPFAVRLGVSSVFEVTLIDSGQGVSRRLGSERYVEIAFSAESDSLRVIDWIDKYPGSPYGVRTEQSPLEYARHACKCPSVNFMLSGAGCQCGGR